MIASPTLRKWVPGHKLARTLYYSLISGIAMSSNEATVLPIPKRIARIFVFGGEIQCEIVEDIDMLPRQWLVHVDSLISHGKRQYWDRKHRHRCQRLGRKRVVLRILRVESCSGDQDTVPDDESCAEKSVTIFEWVWENGVPTHIKNSRLVPTTKSHDIEWMCDGVDVAGSWPHIHRPRKTSHAKTPRVIISNHVSRIRLAIRKRFQTYNSLIVNSYLFDFCYWKLLEAGNILELEVEFVLLPVSTRNEDTILLVLAHTTEWQLSITNISVRTATGTS